MNLSEISNLIIALATLASSLGALLRACQTRHEIREFKHSREKRDRLVDSRIK